MAPAEVGGARVAVRVEGRQLELTNLGKVLYPATGFTKGEVIDYYTRIAPVLLGHLADRALTRVRYPNGVVAKGFFEKNAPAGTPEWVRRERLPAPGSGMNRDMIDYIVADDLATLVWLANLAAVELHTPQWRVGSAGPDRLVIDLDPGPPAGFAECCAVAVLIRERLAADRIEAFPKTSGRAGLQLSCPISGQQDAEQVTAYVKRIAGEVRRLAPTAIVTQMARDLRAGKVFIDWSQNTAAKTTVAPYSLRARPSPTVSTPVTWDELLSGDLDPAALTAPVVLTRVADFGDLLADPATLGPRVPA